MNKNTLVTKARIFSMIIYLILVILYGYVSYQYGKISNPIIEKIEKIDTIVKVDTITYEKPIPKYITQTKTITDTLKTTDTIPQYVEVEVPIESKTYQDSTYYAVISGFRANLDTLKVFPRETTITIEKTSYKPNKGVKIRPSVNVGYGYGMFNKKSDLYIGLGASLTF